MPLIEREVQLGQVRAMIDSAITGCGHVVVIEGDAGIGKTTLLDSARQLATDLGLRALRAQGGELEQELPFAIVRQLFERMLRAASPAFRAEIMAGAAALAAPLFYPDPSPGDASESPAPFVHGLYWVCSNLAEHQPLLIVVDDAHWADEASLRFISHLARRISDLPVLLLISTRPGEPSANLGRALTGLNPDVLHLGPLSAQAVAAVVRAELGDQAGADFCAACAQVTGGNPFLLVEAMNAVRSAGLSPADASAPDVRKLSSAAITRSVLARLSRHGAAAQDVARAVAVLGPDAYLHRVAELAGLAVDAAAAVVDELQRAALLTGDSPVRFVHPLIRSGVYDTHTPMRRAADHKRVVAMLRAGNAPTASLVPHLLATTPGGDVSMVDALVAAADDATSSGSPEIAAQCLRRALTEPAPPERSCALHLQLGRALGFAKQIPDAEAALRQALAAADDATVGADVALELGWLCLITGQGAAAAAILTTALAQIPPDAGRARQLHAMRASTGTMAFENPETWTSSVDDRLRTGSAPTLEERLQLATAAVAAGMSGTLLDADTAGRYAAAAVVGDAPPRERWLITSFAGPALAMCGRVDEALDAFTRAQNASRSEGDGIGFLYLAALRAHFAHYAGNLLEAEADARAALELASIEDPTMSSILAWPLLNILVDRGVADEAERMLVSHGLDAQLPATGGYAAYTQFARGRVRLARGKLDLAIADFIAVGEMFTAGGYLNPAFVHWRSELAAAHLAAGQQRQARRIALEEVDLARGFGAPRAIGVSLRTLALTETGQLRVLLLTESAQVLRSTKATLEQARTLVDLGVVLRHSGSRDEGLSALRAALDLASASRADGLVEHARLELIAAGARPRRHRSTGPAALTPSEHRVAVLARDGNSNREIAQQLFVSRRTVELHLTNAFRKLGAERREQLPGLLGNQ